MINKLRNLSPMALSLLFLVGIAYISHRIWFNPASVLFYADWAHFPPEMTKQLLYAWGTWLSFNGTGVPNIQITFLAFVAPWSMLANLGLSYDFAVKLTLLIPIAILGFVSPYFLAKKISKSNLIAIVVAVYYGASTYFLVRQTIHIPVAFAYAIAPLTFTLFISALEKRSIKRWISFVLVFALTIDYEIRMAFLLTIIFLVYYCCFYIKDIRKQWPYIGFAFITTLGLNIFWLLPTISGGLASTVAAVANRGLFGNSTILRAISMFDAAWTGKMPVDNFIPQPIPIYMWAAPVIIFLTFFFSKNLALKQQKRLLFFAIVALVGIFLNKQSSEPFPTAYKFLYDHLPGFNLFRESSKFYLVTAIGYVGILSYGLVALRESKFNLKVGNKLFYMVLMLVLIPSLWNLKPLINGDIKTLFVNRQISADNKTLNEFLTHDKGYYRTFWLPSDSKWSEYSLSNPKISAIGFVANEWRNLTSKREYNADPTIRAQLLDIFKAPFGKLAFDAASIKYVIVPARDTANDNDPFRYYGGDPQPYIDGLDSTTWLKKLDIGAPSISIYENKSYGQYFKAVGQVFSLPSKDNFDGDFSALASILGREFQFTIEADKNIDSHLTQAADPFSKLDSKSIRSGEIAANIEVKAGAALYVDTNKPSINYVVQGTQVDIYKTQKNSVNIGIKAFAPTQDSKVKINSFKTDSTKSYFFESSGRLTPINLSQGEHTLGKLEGSVGVTSATKVNMIPNADLKIGLWQDRVADCSPYDKSPTIDMDQQQNSETNNLPALMLSSLNHTACTGPDAITVKPGETYALSFDYRVKGGRVAGYEVTFNDPAKTTRKEYLPVQSEQWYALRRSIVAPSAATTMTIKLYGLPDDRQKKQASSFYQRFNLSPLSLDPENRLNISPHYEKVPLPNTGKVSLSYKDSAISGKNLIDNPSFESGAWSSKVSDCNAYDDDPKISMKVNKKSASEGGSSLELSAERHAACTTTTPIDVEENSDYLFSIDAQSPNSNDASYYISFDDPEHTRISQHVVLVNNKWNSFSRTIHIPHGATRATISIYANSDELGLKNVINRYDNLKLIQIPSIQNHFMLVDHDNNLTSPAEIKFSADSSTKKSIHISSASTPFYLTMAESYHPNWRLEMNNAKTQGPNSWLPWAKPDAVPDSSHFKLNDFENGWYVDVDKLCKQQNLCKQNADGSYNMEMVAEFTPQRWFYVGLIISGLTLAGCLGYLGWYWRRRRRGGVKSTRPRPRPTEAPRPVVRRAPRQINLRDEPEN